MPRSARSPRSRSRCPSPSSTRTTCRSSPTWRRGWPRPRLGAPSRPRLNSEGGASCRDCSSSITRRRPRWRRCLRPSSRARATRSLPGSRSPSLPALAAGSRRRARGRRLRPRHAREHRVHVRRAQALLRPGLLTQLSSPSRARPTGSTCTAPATRRARFAQDAVDGGAGSAGRRSSATARGAGACTARNTEAAPSSRQRPSRRTSSARHRWQPAP